MAFDAEIEGITITASAFKNLSAAERRSITNSGLILCKSCKTKMTPWNAQPSERAASFHHALDAAVNPQVAACPKYKVENHEKLSGENNDPSTLIVEFFRRENLENAWLLIRDKIGPQRNGQISPAIDSDFFAECLAGLSWSVNENSIWKMTLAMLCQNDFERFDRTFKWDFITTARATSLSKPTMMLAKMVYVKKSVSKDKIRSKDGGRVEHPPIAYTKSSFNDLVVEMRQKYEIEVTDKSWLFQEANFEETLKQIIWCIKKIDSGIANLVINSLLVQKREHAAEKAKLAELSIRQSAAPKSSLR